MIIYLYKKTHNITGLKYLGKTTLSDPYKYRGSGKHWCRHINKHGYDVTTEIIRVCESKEELKEWGLYYSKLWNIVESKEWANKMPESGDGGAVSEESAAIISKKLKEMRNDPIWKDTIGKASIKKMKETVYSEEWRETKGKQAKEKQANTINNPEWIETVGKSRNKKLSLKAKLRNSDINWTETVRKEGREKENQLKSSVAWQETVGKQMKINMKILRNSTEYKENQYKTCPHCEKVVDPGNYAQWHGDNCKIITKIVRKQEKIQCIHCGMFGGAGNMKRYHFDNCKKKVD